ncbi:hypothetical protein BGX31_006475 [Mortierella sp. GBA43]|nr:hypothetical protein BGX31_006475 [Mortierella sp. GBA43]
MLDSSNLLDLPEIIAMIIRYLDRRDLALCMLIDRTWHTACLAALWKNTVVHTTEPTLGRLTQHRSLIQKLDFNISMNTQLASIAFPNLRSVDFEGRDYETPAAFSMEVKSATCAFLFNNPSIITVAIHRSCVDWMAIAQMKSLRNLTIHRRPYDWLGSEFWTVCAQLESLQMDSIPETTIPGDISFPNLASLALIGVQPYTPNQLDFIRRCPNLKKLRLPFPRVNGEDEILDDFNRLAKENTMKRSAPWARTKEMTQDDGIQRRVFEMFSRLRKLEHIVIGVDYGKPVGLHLIVGRGLELLKDCRYITEIDFEGTDQFITGDDAQWMTNHWKELKQVRGTLNLDRETNRTSETILFDHQCQVNDRDEHEGSEY